MDVIKSLKLVNYKTFEKYTVTFGPCAYLVGPNSAGKSTIISALRAASSMLRIAKSTAPSINKPFDGTNRPGYPFTANRIGLQDENIRFDFRNEDASFEITFKSGASITAVWPASSDEDVELRDPPTPFFFLKDRLGRAPLRAATVRKEFPSIGVIPILTPVDHRESMLGTPYVRSNIDGRLASRHFRNQLYLEYLAEEDSSEEDAVSPWDQLMAHMSEWSPETALSDITTQPDERQGTEIDVYFREPPRRIEKELSWSGDGIQIWLQLLFHTHRLKSADIVVIDEPDVFLHPDLQRRIVQLLASLSGQTITATHSAEVLAETTPKTVVWIDKTRARGVRGDKAPLELADAIGTQFNLDLAKALRSRKIIFVEGKDLRILRHFARKVGASRVANETGIAVLRLDGFSAWDRVEPFKWLTDSFLRSSVTVEVILDGDFRSRDDNLEISAKLGAHGIDCHVWERKEIENYLLVPELLARETGLTTKATRSLLKAVTNDLKSQISARMIEEAHRKVGKNNHRVSISTSVLEELEKRWPDLDYRLAVAGGKDVISGFNGRSQAKGGKSVGAMGLAQRIRPTEVATEVANLMLRINAEL